jgi:uncharacterized membrane protein
MAKNKCYMCNAEPCDNWHVCASHKMPVCVRCMDRYRKSLTPSERKRDMIVHWEDGRVSVHDMSQAK